MSRAPLPYGAQEITQDDIDAVGAVLRSDFITQGPAVDRFEHAVADYLGVAHCVAFANGTAALHAAAAAAGVEAGTEVITTPITFAADANCALYLGGRPRFVDIDPETWNLDVHRAAAAAGPATRAIIAVSYAGLPVDPEPLQRIRENTVVIEDACHALGGVRAGRKVGAPGAVDMTVFSFHPVKAITTGEGGMVATEDSELARRLRAFRTHGIVRDRTSPGPYEGGWYYEMQELGFNYRITDFQCALGESQLRRLDAYVDRRNEIADRYRELLASEERIALPPAARAGDVHAYHLFVVHVHAGAEARMTAFERLRAAGIGVQVHYIPVYRLPYYRDRLGYPQDDCPEAERFYWGAISLPMFPGMGDEDVERVVEALREALE